VWLAGEALKTAETAEKSARADLERADAVRAAGMSTDADALSIRVHLASMREQVLDRRQDVRVARAALNEAMGVPLDSEYELTTPLAGVSAAPGTKTVASSRPDLRHPGLQRQVAETQGAAAKAALYPQIALNGAFEADRGRFVTQGGANWFAGVTMRWSLFNGGADRRRIDEAAHQATAARAEERQVSQSAQLELRQAEASFAAASERIAVAQAAVELARESLRIIKDRFGAGLTTVQELLRNETALVEAEMRRLRALYDQRVAAVMTELAAGTLTGDSDVLR
jgi:outer membrane protein TolC